MTPDRFEERLARFLYERSEEARAVRVGEKETSEQAVIVARYADLFTRERHDELRSAEEGAPDGERERLYRLREACAGGIVVRELADESDRLENAILSARVEFKEELLPLRAAQARLAVLDEYAERTELGDLAADVSAGFNGERYALMQRAEELDAGLSGERDPVRRSAERKRIDLHDLAAALARATERQSESWRPLRERWLDRVLGPGREAEPASSHVSYLRRMSPFAGLYARERSVPVCLETLSLLGFDLAANERIRLDLDDRPQKNPRACVIASDPPQLVHLITRAQGGLHDYQAFLHEAGHALHYAGCEPGLPYTFRKLSRDHALTEIYSYILEAISREPGWHAEHFGLSDEQARDHAEATTFLEALLFRRYTAKLQFELEFWSRFDDDGGTESGYSERLTEATGVRYRPDNFLADMDAGFYSADYLRAWIRAAQLRERLARDVGADWWQRAETGELLRDLFAEGTRPSSEQIAGRLGFDPFDTGPLLSELGA